MAAADKARFYLERSVPDLQELSRKGIFSDEEIAAIVKKRSDFEHVLNAPGSKPGDYVRYSAYEMNVDTLRKKRASRLRIKNTTYNGQKTVLAIFDRATKKFPGDRALWIQYIQFCEKEKANKRLAKVFTAVLRLRPRDWTIWLIAAKHYAETQGDMATARAYLQRGLRFCKNESRLYLEYAKMEMVYLAKLAARRRILGLDEKHTKEDASNDEDEDMLALPDVTMEEMEGSGITGTEHIDQAALQRLSEAPLVRGALPIAIFDAAMKQLNSDLELAAEFYDVAASFDNAPAIAQVREHILDWLKATAPDSAEAIICEASESLVGVDSLSADFPAALGRSLAIVRNAASGDSQKANTRLQEGLILMLLPYMQVKELDEDVRQVVHASIARAIRLLCRNGEIDSVVIKERLANRVRKENRSKDVALLERL